MWAQDFLIHQVDEEYRCTASMSIGMTFQTQCLYCTVWCSPLKRWAQYPFRSRNNNKCIGFMIVYYLQHRTWTLPTFCRNRGNLGWTILIVEGLLIAAGQLCKMESLSRRAMFEEHRASHYTAETMRRISECGLNAVRLPLGYWILQEPGQPTDGLVSWQAGLVVCEVVFQHFQKTNWSES